MSWPAITLTWIVAGCIVLAALGWRKKGGSD